MKTKNYVRKNFYIDPKHYDVMADFAEKRNISASTVLRLIMKKFVVSIEEKANAESTAD